MIGKASAHYVDLISSQMYKTYAVGARKLNEYSRKYQSIQPEIDARIIKQPDITRNGPLRLSGTALPLPTMMF